MVYNGPDTRRPIMKHQSVLTALSLIGALVLAAVPSPAQDIGKFASTVPGPNEVTYVFLGYSGILVRVADQAVAVDPADLVIEEDLPALKTAGLRLILYTHGHGDHFFPPTAIALQKATGAVVAAEASVARQLQGKVPADKLISAEPGKSFTVGKITVDSVAGIHVGPIVLFRIGIGGVRIFHAGDSNYVPLTSYPSELVFLPTGRPSPTASPDAAFRMASDLKPQAVAVFHGSDAQHAEFKKKMEAALPDITVMIPEPGKLSRIVIRK
jgi:L-ascorbate metabolism protein UlaG (beta-lactamase superfamily)